MTQSAVLLNPSRVRSPDSVRSVLRKVLRSHAWPDPIWIETDPAGGEFERIEAARTRGAEILFACGGDGTVMAAAQALSGTDTALAVVPLGSGNLLARSLGLPRDTLGAILVGIDGRRQRIDLGEVDGRSFTVAAGIGLDAQMVAGAPRLAKQLLGWLAYVPAGLRHLPEAGFQVEVRVDNGAPVLRRVRSVLVANVGTLPGGIKLLPLAAAADGLLDVVLIAPTTLREWLRIVARLGVRHPGGAGLETFRGATVEVTTDLPQPREADGEALSEGVGLLVQIRPAALLICVPPATGPLPHHHEVSFPAPTPPPS
ncbi:MAG: diacylglycerol/lipid kinase family protein [Candidatus Dormibacteria bacterium]